MTDIPVPRDGIPATGGPGPRDDNEAACLSDLYTRIVDTLAGYDKLMDKAEAEFLGVAGAFRNLHRIHRDRVAEMLHQLGHEPREGASLVGTVNRAAVEIRSWFDDLSHNVMDALVDGERQVLEAFQTAITASPSPERRGVLQQMHGELSALLRQHAPDGI